MDKLKERKQSAYRENAMTEPVCLVCGEQLGKYGYFYRGKTVCRGCIELIRASH